MNDKNFQSPISALQQSITSATPIPSEWANKKPFKSEEVSPPSERSRDRILKFTIMRYELDEGIPKKRIIAFRVQNLKNGKTDYLEVDIPLEEIDGKSEMEILDYAYYKLKNKVDHIKSTANNIIGTEYVPLNES